MSGPRNALRLASLAFAFLLLASFVPAAFAFTTGENPSVKLPYSGFGGTSGITIDKAGNMWVADCGGEKVFEFAPPFKSATSPIATLSLSSCPAGIAFDSHGNLWVTEPFQPEILVFAPPFNAPPVFTMTSGVPFPYAVAFDKSGNLWVADYNAGVLEFAPPYTGSPMLALMTKSAPAGVTFDSHGNLWVTSYYNGVDEFSPPFRSTSSPVLAIKSSGAATSAFDSQGNLWVSHYYGNQILEYSPPYTSQPAVTLSSGLSQPWTTAFDSQGNLWVTNYNQGAGGSVLMFSRVTYPPVSATPPIPLSALPTTFHFFTLGGTPVTGTFVGLLGPSKAIYNVPGIDQSTLNAGLANGDFSLFPNLVNYCSTTVNGQEMIKVSGFSSVFWGGPGLTSTEMVFSNYHSYFTSATGWPSEPACS